MYGGGGETMYGDDVGRSFEKETAQGVSQVGSIKNGGGVGSFRCKLCGG